MKKAFALTFTMLCIGLALIISAAPGLLAPAAAAAQQFQTPGPLQGNEANAIYYSDSAGHTALNPNFTFDGTYTRIPAPILGHIGNKPTCAAGVRGLVWYTAGAADAADTLEACTKAADNSYAWTALY